MLKSDFTEFAAGKLVSVEGNSFAFVPNPLPPDVEFTMDLLNVTSLASHELGMLAGMGSQLPNPDFLIEPFMRREAVASSQIEGSQASLSDLLKYEAAPTDDDRSSDVKEVKNYVQALRHGVKMLKEIPISLRLIRDMHKILMTDVRGGHATPGEFRKIQNFIGPKGCTMETATHVPPPVPDMLVALDHLEKFIHEPSNLPPLIRIALVHYQFEAIHPFIDGNGRVGRLLITLMLINENILPMPLSYLSAYLESNRREYYRSLRAVSQNGEWLPWVQFILYGLAEQCKDANARAHAILDLQKSIRERLAGADGRMLQVVDQLFVNPVATIGDLARTLSLDFKTVQKNLLRLVELGIVSEATGKSRNRIFIADEILDLLQVDKI